MAIARILRATNLFDNIPARARNRVIFWTRRYAREIERWIHGEMKKPKHGRTYIIKGRRHVASAPGEVPAILTGRLYNSLTPKYTNGGMRAVISPNVLSERGAPYPKYLEEGTERMAPRPYLQRGFNRYRAAYRSKIRSILTELANE